MGRWIAIILVVLAVFVALGILVPAVFRARSEEEFRRCQNNLRMIGNLGMFHSTIPGQAIPEKPNDYVPPATLINPDLAFEKRLSWYVMVLPAIDQGPQEPEAKQANKHQRPQDSLKDLDSTKAWDADANQSLGKTRLKVAICPGNRPDPGADQPGLTSYLANGGIGLDAPTLEIEKAGPNAGVFRYDSRTPLAAIRDGDGLSHSIAIVESAKDLGPWLRAGPSTTRCLHPDKAPYLGNGNLYGGCHPGRGNYAMADGSVRVFTDGTTPTVFRAALTISGGEKEVDFE